MTFDSLRWMEFTLAKVNESLRCSQKKLIQVGARYFLERGEAFINVS